MKKWDKDSNKCCAFGECKKCPLQLAKPHSSRDTQCAWMMLGNEEISEEEARLVLDEYFKR